MPVTYLELENFKSYAGLQRIGPFRSFTCVIGPNGSGKSNLMDAISFVLGVQSRELRSSQMRDLIFRPPGAERDATLSARASLVYLDNHYQDGNQDGNQDGSQDSNQDGNQDSNQDSNQENNQDNKKRKKARGRTIVFSRLITTKGTGEYQINHMAVTFKTYESRLASIGVLLKARNFLVFQGDVESMARKNPRQLVDMFENLSGSAELKDEYDQALRHKEDAEQKTIFAFNKTKEHKSERRLLKEQKEEAERFRNLLQQRSNLKTNFFLWILFHIHSDIQQHELALSEIQSSVEEQLSFVNEKQRSLDQAKNHTAEARRDTLAKDQQKLALEQEVDQLQPSVIQSTEAMEALNKKLKMDDKILAKILKDQTTHSDKLGRLQTQIQSLQQQEQDLQSDYDQRKQSENVVLTEQQEQQLERIRDAAAVASAKVRMELQSAARGLESARARAGRVMEDGKELLAKRDEAQRGVAELKMRKTTLEKSLKKTKEDLATSETELQTLLQSHHHHQTQRDAVEAQLETILNTLRQAKDDRRKDKDEERVVHAIASLKRHFVGVKGRLVDLCRPSQNRFNLAVTVAAGKDMDAIVVDTKETGFDCIKYLRDQRIGTATFLPLDSLQIPSPESTEHIRGLAEQDGRYRLAADVIRVDDDYRRAVLYAVGNTVVCDSLDVAREICFGKRRNQDNQMAQVARLKAVTLGGAVISKAGTMTGGVTKDDTNRAGRWSDQKLEELRAKKEALETQRADLDVMMRGNSAHSAKVEDLRIAIGNLRNKEQFTKSDLDYTKKKLKEQTDLLNESKRQSSRLEREQEEAEDAVQTANSLVERHRKEVKDVEEEHFAPFRESTGVRDLRAYDEAIGKAREEFVAKRTEIREQLAKLTAMKKYEDEKDFDAKLTKAQKKKDDHERMLDEETKAHEKLLSDVADIKAKLADAESSLKQALLHEQELDEKVRDAQAILKETQDEHSKIIKEMNTEESELMRLRQKLHETLQKARVEEVELPIIRQMDERLPKPSQERPEEDTQSSSRRLSQPMTQESTMSSHFSQREDSRVAKDRRDAGKLDFSVMDEDLKMRRSAVEEDKLRKKFENKISKLSSDIDSIAPNMKASEAFDTMTERVKETMDDFNAAKEEGRRANDAFNKIRKARSHRFNTAFKQIDQALKIIYTDMTKSSKHPLGGNAYLSLDDSEEPYRGGMKFNAMPPMKRFRDMEQLSGGEKTVAALSLLFAIHSFRPAPFFIMDEVDAALDNVNVLKVCNYIRQRSDDFQCIVISLKDMFYERSETLIGICRDVGSNSSRTMSLDLTKFDRQEERKRESERKRALATEESIVEGGETESQFTNSESVEQAAKRTKTEIIANQ